MNKILMDGDKYTLTNYQENLVINGDACIYIFNSEDDLNLNIKLNDNASLKMYDFNLCNKSSKIVVTQENNSSFDYYHTFKIEGEYSLDYIAYLNGDNNINNINISGVSRGFVKMNVDGVIKDGTTGNELNENIKILTNKGKAFISPMLHVSVLDVIANHNTTISNVREDELFYLMSKGIERGHAYKLIEDGYLYGIIKNTEFINMIK